MNRLRLLTFASLGVLAACGRPDSALRVNVTVRQQGTTKVRADCLKLQVLDEAGTELKSLVVKRPDDDTAVFAVRRGTDLPATVKVQVLGLLGTCADEATLLLNAQSDPETSAFPEAGVSAVELFLDPAGATLDADRDGFVAASRGGPDCRDDDRTIYPNAGQTCANTTDTDCDGKGGCDDTECTAAVVCADPPDQVVVSANFTSMLRYECSQAITVELRNLAGPRVAVRDTMVALSTSLPGTTLHATSNCGEAPVTALPIPYGSSSFLVYLKADAAAFGTATITATASQVAGPGTLNLDVRPQPIDHLAFTSTPRTLTAGACGAEPVTLEFQDAQNRRTDVVTDTSVTFTVAPEEAMNANIFFADAACGTAAASPTLTAGQGTLTLYLLARRAGAATLRAAPSDTTPAVTQPLVVNPSSASKLAFPNAPLALLTTQTCSPGTLQVQLRDQFDNATTMTTPLAVRVSVTGLTDVRFAEGTDTACAVAATDFTLPANSSSLFLRAAATTATGTMGTVRVAPTASPTITAATQDLFVATGPPTRFTWDGQAQSPVAGVCSANPLTIRLTDATDNTTSSSSAMGFSLATAPGADPTFRFFANAGCGIDLDGGITIPPNQTSAQVYFRGERVRTAFELRATSDAGLLGPTTPATGNTIRPNVPAKLAFVGPLTQTARANECTPQPYVAELRDGYNNPTTYPGAMTVDVEAQPADGGVAVGVAPNCGAGSTATLAANTSQVSFSARGIGARTYTLTAKVDGFSTAPADLVVTPGPASLYVDVPTGGASTLMAGGCQAVTITRHDLYGNPAPLTGPNPLTFSYPAGTTWLTWATPGCTGPSGGALSMTNASSITFSMSPQHATGALPVTVTIAGQNAMLNFQVSPGAPLLVFEAPDSGTSSAAATQVAGGCTRVALNRRDTFFNDVPVGPDAGIGFSLVAGTTAHTDSTCDAGSSVAFLPVAPTDSRGQFWVRATVASPVAQTVAAALQMQTANLALTVSPGTATLRVTAPPLATAAPRANDCVQVAIERRDEFGNLVPVTGSPSITLAPEMAGMVFEGFTTDNCTGMATTSIPMTAGTASKIFSVRSSKAGAQVINVTLSGQTLPVTLNVTPNVLDKLLVENLPATLTARSCVGGLVVRRRDFWDNDITGDAALTVALSSPRYQFSTDGACTGAASPLNVTINMGSAVSSDTVFVTASSAGSATATANSVPAGATGSATGNVVAGPAHHLSFLAGAGSVTAGVCSGQLQVELRDFDENRVTPPGALPLTLGSTNAVTFASGATCMGALPAQLTTALPTATFSFRPRVATASEVVTASVTTSDGGVFGNSQTWTVVAGAASVLAWKQDPATPVTRFGCASAGVIRTTDSSDNVVPAANDVTVTPQAAGSGGVTFFTDNTCTTPLTTFTILAGASEGAEFFFQATGSGTASFTASGASMTSYTAAPARSVLVQGTQGSLTLAPSAGVVDVEASACLEFVVTRRDDVGNPLTVGSTSLTASVPVVGTPLVTLYTAAGCAGAGSNSVARTIAHGASTTSFWVRGRSAATQTDVTLTVADVNSGSTSATPTLRVYPLVRRGTCNLADTEPSKTCTLTPAIPNGDLTRSFLVFTSTGRPATAANTLDAADQAVECHLESGNVSCSRAGSSQAMSINYQVVSFGRDAAAGGVSVQHYQVNTTGAVTSQAITAVDTTRSFILTSNTMSGSVSDGDAFPIVNFNGGSTVDITTNTATPTRKVAIQVVTLGAAGVAVDHRDVSNPTQTAGGFSVGTNATTNAIALAQARLNTDSRDVNYMCKRRLNTKVAASAVTLHRGVGGTPDQNCTTDAVVALNVQRIGFGTAGAFATVRVPSDVTLNNVAATANSAQFAAVAPHKAITLLMLQGPGGQTAGESNFMVNQNDGDDTSAFHALLGFNGTGDRVSVTRTAPAANATSVFSPIVVEFAP